ncbi:hypothetical protein BO86DRAFT_434528, partial [Aspergillus japonicus CBS 114.51]
SEKVNGGNGIGVGGADAKQPEPAASIRRTSGSVSVIAAIVSAVSITITATSSLNIGAVTTAIPGGIGCAVAKRIVPAASIRRNRVTAGAAIAASASAAASGLNIGAITALAVTGTGRCCRSSSASLSSRLGALIDRLSLTSLGERVSGILGKRGGLEDHTRQAGRSQGQFVDMLHPRS